MSTIHVIHENNEWTIHLERRLQELGLPYEMWHLDEGTLDLSDTPPQGVFYNRISASSHTRGHRYAPEFASGVIAWLESHGRTVVNGSRALELEVSKVKQYLALEAAGIKTPRTLAAVGRDHILAAAKQLNAPSFITKHNRAGKGLGVRLFHSTEALETYLDSPDFEEPVDGITLLQQYVQAPKPFIVRHEFVGGQFLYGVRVDTSEGFELCPADACSIEDRFCPAGTQPEELPPKFEILEDYRPQFIDRYEAFLSANNILVAGIEAIESAEGVVYTYDVNTNTNYNSDAEEQAGTFGMLALAKYLGSLLG